MTLRCKPGDLAVIVNGENENLGRLVEVLRLHESGRWHIRAFGKVRVRSGRLVIEALAHDNRLRPLRDQDGTDEVLRIAQRTA